MQHEHVMIQEQHVIMQYHHVVQLHLVEMYQQLVHCLPLLHHTELLRVMQQLL